MIAGANYMEIDSDATMVTVTIREDGVTATAYLSVNQAVLAKTHIADHLHKAMSYRSPGLIEYTGPDQS